MGTRGSQEAEGSWSGTRLPAPEGARDVQVYARWSAGEGLNLQGRLDGKGGYEIRGVPPGRWKVTAHATQAGAFTSVQGEAAGGQTLDLVLGAR